MSKNVRLFSFPLIFCSILTEIFLTLLLYMENLPNPFDLCNGNGTEKKQKYAKFSHKRTNKRIEAVKRKARSELRSDNWDAVGYAYDDHCKYEERDESSAAAAAAPFLDTIERIDGSTLGEDALFWDRVERAEKPVVLTGLTDNWAAHHQWTTEKLLRGYRNQTFKCGEDDDGYSVKLKLKYYVDYATTTRDDSPLYIFDSSFGERTKTSKLLADYSVPPMFKDDLFRYATERRRPPYRWFVMGPARSGTAIHIDPLGTSAWNALIVGQKRWCLIHPNTPKHLVKPLKEERNFHSDEAITWFQTVFRRVISPHWPSERFPVIHAIQKAGEVIFVPSGWWHVVLNLDMTIAITQNFASVVNLSRVWPKTVRTRRAFAIHWLKALQRERPELMGTICSINQARAFTIPWDLSEPFDSSSSSSSSSSCSSSDESDAHNNNNNNGNGNVVSAQRQRTATVAAATAPKHFLDWQKNGDELPHRTRTTTPLPSSPNVAPCCSSSREGRRTTTTTNSDAVQQQGQQHQNAKRTAVGGEEPPHVWNGEMAKKRRCLTSPRFGKH